MEILTDFIFLGSKITADGDCSHEIKRQLLLGRKTMTNLDSIVESRDITLSTKVHLVKAMVFPVFMYGWELDYKESWALKNWCFWIAMLEKTLESPLDLKEIQILVEISPQYSLEGVMLKLKLQYFGHLMRRADSLENILMPRKIAGGRIRGRQRMKWNCWMASPSQWRWVWVNFGNWWWTGRPGMLQSMGTQRVEHDWVAELNWTWVR